MKCNYSLAARDGGRRGLLRSFYRIILCLLLLPCLTAVAKPAPRTEILFWHSFSGDLGEILNDLVTTYNDQQNKVVVRPVYKGDYVSALTSFAAAFHAKQPPALMQVFEVGTATMLAPAGIMMPTEAFMRKYHRIIPKNSFFPAVLNFYSRDSELQALPFNTSVPVIFYDADLLAKLGYDETNFPQTWDGLEQLSAKIRQAGVPCAYTSAFPSWIQVESFSALHGFPLIDPKTHQANFNHPAILQHLTRLKRWQREHYFEYGGRADDATVLFTSGHCAMISQSSGGYHSLSSLVPFRVGVASLPIDKQLSATRHSNVVGGAALWVIQGQSDAVYAGIADFFTYWMQPKVQAQWSEKTGYIPLGVTGVYRSILDKSHSPTLLIAKKDFQEGSSAVIVSEPGPLNFLRTIYDEALEAIFADMKTPQQAMNHAMMRSNYALMRFRQNTVVG